MLPTGYKRIIHSFKGLRSKDRRKLIGKEEKRNFKRSRKNRMIDRSIKRGEKHLYRKYMITNEL